MHRFGALDAAGWERARALKVSLYFSIAKIGDQVIDLLIPKDEIGHRGMRGPQRNAQHALT